MKTVHGVFGRLQSALLLVALAGLMVACASKTGDGSASAPEQTAAQQGQAQDPAQGQTAAPPDPLPITPQGVVVAILLADTLEQEGWAAVPVQGGVLYVNPQPVITRGDLINVQAGSGRSGEGLLALGLSPEAQMRLSNITAQFPNKRLALVVGRSMLAAPGYTAPVTHDKLVFPVGTQQNAAAAVHAIMVPLSEQAEQAPQP